MRTFHQELGKVIQGWNGNDQLIFYFSGHGEVLHDLYCLKFGKSASGYLPFNNLLNWLRIAGVVRSVLILDSCHSGAAVGKKGKEVEISSILPKDLPQGIAVLASCRVSQSSYELPDKSASVFTKLFCDGIETGLNGKPTADGYIGVSDIVDYVGESLREPPYASFPQDPVYDIHHATRAVWLSRNKSGDGSSQSPSAEHPPVPGISSIEELRLAYENVVKARHPCAGATSADLDWDCVSRYAKSIGYTDPASSLDETLLAELGLFSPLSGSSSRTLHNAAALCFCRRPEKFLPQARSVFLLGEIGSDKFIQKSVVGPLSSQLGELVQLTMEHLRANVSSFGQGGLRRDEPEIPEALVRELISNAVAHRDYSAPGTVQVWVNAEALEVQSPGSFPGNTSWETFLTGGRVSCPVDPAIALYLTRLLALEGIGRGFGVFRDYIAENGGGSMICQELPGPTTRIRVLRPQFGRRSGNRPIKILILTANPFETAALELDREVRAIEASLRVSGQGDEFEIVARPAVRPDDLLQALNRFKPQIVHFSGHGTQGGEIIFSDERGGARPVGAAALGSLFRAMKDNIRVVVLNACYSLPQAKAIAEQIGCAVGMGPISDRAAIIFASSFYLALGYGRSVQDAFEQGKAALMLQGLSEHVLELVVRAGVDPARVTLVPPPQYTLDSRSGS